MACGNVNTFAGRVLAAEVRHPVEGLDSECVRGVRQQAPHFYPATQQAVLRGPVADQVPAGETGRFGRPAHGAADGVAQVGSSTIFQRLVPLQNKSGVVDQGVDSAWGWGGFYSRKDNGKTELAFHGL